VIVEVEVPITGFGNEKLAPSTALDEPPYSHPFQNVDIFRYCCAESAVRSRNTSVDERDVPVFNDAVPPFSTMKSATAVFVFAAKSVFFTSVT
jgi:hypothetical protein